MILFIAYVFIIAILLMSVYIITMLDRPIQKDKPTSATDVLIDIIKDPLVTSRAYFTEPATGPIGDFVGYSPVSQDDWLHRLPHEESQDEGGKYHEIRSLI